MQAEPLKEGDLTPLRNTPNPLHKVCAHATRNLVPQALPRQLGPVRCIHMRTRGRAHAADSDKTSGLSNHVDYLCSGLIQPGGGSPVSLP
jgi:hypothetical protein